MPWFGTEDDLQPEDAKDEDSNNCNTSGQEGDVDACLVANNKNADNIGGRNSLASSPSSKSVDQDEEQGGVESVQEQDDEQGDEKEEGAQQEVIERVQEAIAEAEERVEKAAEDLEEAIEELLEEKNEDKEGQSTKRKMRRSAKDLVKGGEGEDMEDDEGLRKEDRLGQAGPLETMDDEE
ncbi:hypothetical protein EDD21DRAFT_372737 [Dissophora ornata]|nr:hypothetical protein EDD21DRAFT_372737 [Dissophora ornata]